MNRPRAPYPRYTGERNVVVVEDAHHGNIGVTLDISPKMYSK